MKKRIADWGQYPVIEANEQSFTFNNELNDLVKHNDNVIARGSGRCYGDSALATNTISTLKYDNILFFDTINGVITCQPGITLEQLLQVIVPQGWFLPVTPGTKLITIGGAVASNVHGKNHRKDGSFSKHVIEIELRLASNESVICSPTQNADLFEATCGGMGLTGIITLVTFRLKKIETSFIKQKQIKAGSLDELLYLFEQYRESDYAVAWIDCLKKGKHFGRGILTIGQHALLSDLNKEQKNNPLHIPDKKKLNFPFNLPAFVLNNFTVKAFNLLFYTKNLKKETESTVGYDSFFYPLDAINNWNRMYGKKGFVQYQFVLPLTAKHGLIEILNRISRQGQGSFLTVLKVLGKQESMISFPREGYTLALDFPVRDGLFEFLDELDAILVKHGGRIYLTKDARMKAAMMESGYPELQKFKAIVNQYNPDGKFRSLQSDRLNLTTTKL